MLDFNKYIHTHTTQRVISMQSNDSNSSSEEWFDVWTDSDEDSA